jgi:hypothetical protein
MTPAQLDVLAMAKRIAQPFANAARSRSVRHVDLLTAGMSADELLALAVLLAEAADLEILRLVCLADDGGMVARAS